MNLATKMYWKDLRALSLGGWENCPSKLFISLSVSPQVHFLLRRDEFA